MRVADILKLILLGAIWGSAFAFLRIVSPALGPIPATTMRAGIAGATLLAYFRFAKIDPEWRKYGKAYVVAGVVNCSLPFTLFAFAAKHIPAAYSAILNSTAPLFGFVFGAIWLHESLSWRRLIGLLLGAGGVALVAGVGAAHLSGTFLVAMLACLGGSVCYGWVGIYLRRHARGANPIAIAGAGQVTATLSLLPLLPFSWGPMSWSPVVVFSLLALAFFSSAIGFVLYYPLMVKLGPTRSLTVTFLIPLFGMLWGSIFLGEAVTPVMLFGTALILVGTAITLITPVTVRASEA